MVDPLTISKLVEEWLRWANWASDPANKGRSNGDLIGHFEFDWIVRDLPDYAWQAILAVVADHRAEAHLGLLAAGPVEDLLSLHGQTFIDRVEHAARSDRRFAEMLREVSQSRIQESVWLRVQGAAL